MFARQLNEVHVCLGRYLLNGINEQACGLSPHFVVKIHYTTQQHCEMLNKGGIRTALIQRSSLQNTFTSRCVNLHVLLLFPKRTNINGRRRKCPRSLEIYLLIRDDDSPRYNVDY